MDNNEDTHVFGKNAHVFFTTPKKCTVSPFLQEYPEKVGVPIVTGETTVNLKHGSTVILIFGQRLWIGYCMDKTLIKPNQCRHYSIHMCNNLTDNYRELGIKIDDDLFISMVMDGSTCGFISRLPT